MGAIPPPPSTLTRLLSTHPPPADVSPEHHALALQIAHNLRFQHAWTDLRLHRLAAPQTTTPANPKLPSLPPPPPPRSSNPAPAQTPLVLSGLPPRRLYVHPDEQIAELQRQKDVSRRQQQRQPAHAPSEANPQVETETETEIDADADADADAAAAFQQPTREWVLPSHIREKWSLRRLAGAFDGLAGDAAAASSEGMAVFARESGVEPASAQAGGSTTGASGREDEGNGEGGDGGGSGGRTASRPKRLLLATLDDDSTVVYYVVHDGVVKPRQN